ncbi:MAG: hypothetical protein MK212_16415 [Saprospiraceae bacterium]|nr:hypothetical protein [Saprospiraceae bacterium]
MRYLTENKFNTRELPLPEISLGMHYGYNTKKKALTTNQLHKMVGISAELLDWQYEVRLSIVEFDVLAQDSTGKHYSIHAFGNRFNQEQLNFIKDLKSGDFFIANDIRIKTPSGIKNVGSLIYQIEE